MKPAALFLVPLLLTACSSGGNIAENTAAPPLNVMSETPGDWSDLGGMVGRTPAASGLFEASAITVDLNALLGAEAEPFRLKAETGSVLVREGPVLVTIGGDRDSYLIIMPSDHALAAGLKKGGRWKRWTTPGAEVPLPANIRALVQPSG